MKTLLLSLILVPLATLSLGQTIAAKYASNTILTEANVKPRGEKHFGGISAIEYVSKPTSGKPYWILVSDAGDENKNDKKSYSFTSSKLNDSTKIDLLSKGKFYGIEQVESVRFHNGKFFFVTEEDSLGKSRIGYIIGRGYKSLYSESLKDNKGFESLAFSPGKDSAMWVAFEVKQEDGTVFYRFNFDQTRREYTTNKKDKFQYELGDGYGISEILFIDKDHLLVLEKYHKDNVTNANLYPAQINESNHIVEKGKAILQLDKSNQAYTDNLEGMAWGPKEGGQEALYIISDNNFKSPREQKTVLIKYLIDIKELDYTLDTTKFPPSTPTQPSPTTKPNKTDCTDELINNSVVATAQTDTCLCHSAKCTCPPRKIVCNNCGSTTSKHTYPLTFNKDGVIVSKLPGAIQNGDEINVKIDAKTLTEKSTPIGKQFTKSTEYWNSPKTTLDDITRSIGFKKETDVSKLIDEQFNKYYKPLSSFFSYSLSISGGNPSGSNTFPSTFTVNATSTDEKVELLLWQNHTDNQFLKDVFTSHKKDYKSWQPYKPLFDSLYPKFVAFSSAINQLIIQRQIALKAAKDCNCSDFDNETSNINEILCRYLDRVETTQAQLCAITKTVIDTNRCWLRSWLWYTGGRPLLNPFGFSFESDEQIDQQIATNEELLKLYHELATGCCGADLKVSIDKLKPLISQVSQKIINLKKKKDTIAKREESYKKNLKTLAQTKLLLNKSFLFVSDQNKVNWMNHYDAQNDYAYMNPDKSLPELVYEDDRVQALVHNLTSDQKVSATQTVTKKELRTDIDIKTDPVGQALAIALGSKIAQGTDNQKSTTHSALPSKFDCNLETRIKAFNDVLSWANWLHEQTEPPIQDLQTAYDNFDSGDPEPVFHSQDAFLGQSRNTKGTNQINYQILEAGKEKPVVKDSFQTYATVRWWPFVSINYVFGSRAIAIFDNTKMQFQTNTDIDNFEAIGGVKWYLKATNITRTYNRTKFIRETLGASYNKERGNAFLSRTFLFLGLGMRHSFLKNYGLGIGYDISPGFSIQGGANIFFRKSYELDNGQIKREFDIPSVRGLIGISIDPNVVTKFISLF